MSDPAPASILVVDDDLGLLRVVERALKREGFATATSSSGQAATDWLAHKLDLLLLDLKLQDIRPFRRAYREGRQAEVLQLVAE